MSNRSTFKKIWPISDAELTGKGRRDGGLRPAVPEIGGPSLDEIHYTGANVAFQLGAAIPAEASTLRKRWATATRQVEQWGEKLKTRTAELKQAIEDFSEAFDCEPPLSDLASLFYFPVCMVIFCGDWISNLLALQIFHADKYSTAGWAVAITIVIASAADLSGRFAHGTKAPLPNPSRVNCNRSVWLLVGIACAVQVALAYVRTTYLIAKNSLQGDLGATPIHDWTSPLYMTGVFVAINLLLFTVAALYSSFVHEPFRQRVFQLLGSVKTAEHNLAKAVDNQSNALIDGLRLSDEYNIARAQNDAATNRAYSLYGQGNNQTRRRSRKNDHKVILGSDRNNRMLPDPVIKSLDWTTAQEAKPNNADTNQEQNNATTTDTSTRTSRRHAGPRRSRHNASTVRVLRRQAADVPRNGSTHAGNGSHS